MTNIPVSKIPKIVSEINNQMQEWQSFLNGLGIQAFSYAFAIIIAFKDDNSYFLWSGLLCFLFIGIQLAANGKKFPRSLSKLHKKKHNLNNLEQAIYNTEFKKLGWEALVTQGATFFFGFMCLGAVTSFPWIVG